MTNYYVTKNPNGSWNAKKQGGTRASSISLTQKEAESQAKQFCASSGGEEVRIQGRDGKFRDSNTTPPGNDPCPPKDTVY